MLGKILTVNSIKNYKCTARYLQAYLNTYLGILHPQQSPTLLQLLRKDMNVFP